MLLVSKISLFNTRNKSIKWTYSGQITYCQPYYEMEDPATENQRILSRQTSSLVQYSQCCHQRHLAISAHTRMGNR